MTKQKEYWSDYELALALQRESKQLIGSTGKEKSQAYRSDFEVALDLQKKMNFKNPIGVTENATFPAGVEKENYVPKSLSDSKLESIDPNPNVHTLFVQFNKKFFWNVLLPVEVKWSNRMTSCAGTCSFHPRNRQCVISLSAPLLQLRPRKDLIETLLHEMIHGYLFLTNNNRDRVGHGPEFQKHMHRINREAGLNITIYHTFHAEVRFYQQHWWRCNGPCTKRAPHFGMVRRASNRAPSKNDFWWSEHELTCGGTFIKVKEPESYKSKKKKINPKDSQPSNSKSKWNPTNVLNPSNTFNKNTSTNTKEPGFFSGSSMTKGGSYSKTTTVRSNNTNSQTSTNSLEDSLKKLGNGTNSVHGWGTGGPKSNSSTNVQSSNGVKKLGNNTNTVHGWGTGGPGTGSIQQTSKTSTSSSGKTLSFSGTLGGSITGRSNLIDKFQSNNIVPKSNNKLSKPNLDKNNTDNSINSIYGKNKFFKLSNEDKVISNAETKDAKCPMCHKLMPMMQINIHLDSCLLKSENVVKSKPIVPEKSEFEAIDIDCDNMECPVCKYPVKLEDMNDHIDSCLEKQKNSKKRPLPELIDLTDSPPSYNRKSSQPDGCFVCNISISGDMTLDEHLEMCIGDVFKDDTIICDTNDDIPEEDKKTDHIAKHEFPCPICSEFVKEIDMNAHLDLCHLNT